MKNNEHKRGRYPFKYFWEHLTTSPNGEIVEKMFFYKDEDRQIYLSWLKKLPCGEN